MIRRTGFRVHAKTRAPDDSASVAIAVFGVFADVLD
jgi:hypothetical protein